MITACGNWPHSAAPTNFQWGMREMNVEDPDGHRQRVGHATDAPSTNVKLCAD